MNHKDSIDLLLDVVGGVSNIKSIEHCATRLRLILVDDNVVIKERALAIPKVKGYFYHTGQHQFIFGTGTVNEVYAELKVMGIVVGSESGEEARRSDIYSKLSLSQRMVRILADILIPLIPALVTTGLLMGIRGLMLNLGVEFSPAGLTLFGMLTDTAFAFLPVLIAYSATKRFGGNPILGIVVGLMMVAPQLPNAWAVAGGSAEPLSVGVFTLIGYQGSILPSILVGFLVSWFERTLRKVVPAAMDLIVTPFLSITLTITIILFGLGPVIQLLERTVIGAIVGVLEAPFGIGYIIFAGIQQLITITGLHHSLGIVELNLLSNTGLNVIQPLTSVSMAGQLGAAVASALLMQNQLRRINALSSTYSTLFGITEPLLFGVNLQSIRIFGAGMLAGALGGLLVYLFDLKAAGMGITFIPGLLLYLGQTSFLPLIQYVVVILLSFGLGFLFVMLQAKTIRGEINAR